MKYRIKLMAGLVGVAVAMSLSACSGTFRNRNLEYLRQPVTETAPVATPPGLSEPNTKPALTLPAGQTAYPAEAKPAVNMTPPGFNTPTPVPVAPKASAIASSQTAAVSNQTVATSSQAAAVNSPTVAASSQATAVSTPVAAKPQALTRQTVEHGPAVMEAKAAPLASSVVTSTTPNAQVAVVPTQAAMAPKVVATTVPAAAEATSPSNSGLPSLHPALSYDSNEGGLIQVKAPASQVFERVGTALEHAPRYEVNTSSAAQGYYYLSPSYTQAPGYDLMVSVWAQDGVTQVQIYDMNGNVATSHDAKVLLNAINQALAD